MTASSAVGQASERSDPTDLEFLCFDINQRAAVYILYDKRATDRPTWLKSDAISISHRPFKASMLCASSRTVSRNQSPLLYPSGSMEAIKS